ncbi:MAG: RNA polymerase sigma factor [Acidobacteriota bacterium]
MSAALRFALRWSKSDEDAEDIVQEAMQRLLLYDHIENPRAWLAVVVRRLAWRLHRERQREGLALEEERHRVLESPPPATVGARLELESVLAQVARHDRRLLLLDAAGFSDEEISRKVGCRPGSIHTLLTRARQRLRRAGGE